MSAVVADTSALVAVVRDEPGSQWLLTQLHRATGRVISAPNALELGMVIETTGVDQGSARRILRDADIAILPFDSRLSERAIDAFHRFGKGRHPAALNFGDCCTYALAEELGAPILCVGNDFARTDLPVLRPPH